MNRYLKGILFILRTAISLTIFPITAHAADYTVVKDDSLYKIGVLFKTTVTTLKSENALQSDEIRPGQLLKIDAQIYTVSSGDTLYLIAKRYWIPLDNLRKANNKWDDMLFIGQKLILPGVKTSSTQQQAVIPYTQDELNLLSRLITAETTGQPYDAMVAVGGVVINRVKSTEWPNSISTVINHVADGYYQFTPVKNGYINNPPSDIAIKAAWAALYGNDPSNGALFYFDDSSTNQWLWSKQKTATIGNMVFVK